MQIKGNLVDIINRKIYGAIVTIEGEKIVDITETDETFNQYIMPGFIDAHIHIESSMLVPSEFAPMAVKHGTVATVSDPHEIANVLGIEGVYYMIENGKQVPFKFNFGAPSCVPATTFETAGAVIDSNGIDELLQNPDIKYLAEMMNYPGVLFNDKEVHKKIALAKRYNKPIDGHAPGLKGEKAKQYIDAGISTDHECFTLEEAQDKLNFGMKIIIREGSAAKNYEALIPLLDENFEKMMFCSDDKHPDDLMVGHINQLAARAVKDGNDVFKVLQATCINPIEHYNLDVGQLRVGDFADCIVVEDLENFKVKQTYVNGALVADNGKSLIEPVEVTIQNNFKTSLKKESDFEIQANSSKIRVIKAIDGSLITESFMADIDHKDGLLEATVEQDILKVAVINRYSEKPPAIAFIEGFHLKEGAIASCVAHDSHNIIAVGVDDASITKAVNLVIENTGGISAVGKEQAKVLPLPIAGIMSNQDGKTVGEKYAAIDTFSKDELGSTLKAPFMTLSFMALLVIPSLKLSDLGLFDGNEFKFVELLVSPDERAD